MNKSPNMDPADKAFSDAIRRRDNFQCQYCGRIGKDTAYIDCAHIVGRRDKALRWDADNAITLCREHHRYFTDHPAEFRCVVRNWKGQDYLDELDRRRRMVLKVNAARLKEIAKHYRDEAKRMANEKTHDLKPWVPFELYALRARSA